MEKPIRIRWQILKTWLNPVVLTGVVICSTSQSASAAMLSGTTFSAFLECLNDGVSLVAGQNSTDATGWQYALDSSTDGVAGSDIAGNEYEIYSMGLKETDDSIYIAINSNTPYPGNPVDGVGNGTVAFGDLFINLNAATSFSEAMDAGNLYAIRFVDTNDSGVPQLGLYGNVIAQSVTSTNTGFNSINDYNQHVIDNGGTPSFGDLAATTPYFDVNQSLNSIASGNFITGITLLSDTDLTDAGFNRSQAPGQYTIAFKLDKAALLGSNSSSEPVPEPNAIAGLAVLGTILLTRRTNLN